MTQIMKYDYEPEHDFLHIYSSKIYGGVKGCLSLGDYTIDIGLDNDVVGIEVEEASKLLKLDGESLKNLDSAELTVRKVGNLLFIGFIIIKNKKESMIQFSVPERNTVINVSG